MYFCSIPQVNSSVPKLWETNLNNTCVEKPCPPRIKQVFLVLFTWFKVCSSAHNGDWCQGFSGCAYHLKRRPIFPKRKNGSGWNFSVPLHLLIFLWAVYNSVCWLSLFFLWLFLCKLPSSAIPEAEKVKNLFPGLFFCLYKREPQYYSTFEWSPQ